MPRPRRAGQTIHLTPGLDLSGPDRGQHAKPFQPCDELTVADLPLWLLCRLNGEGTNW